MRVAHVTPMFLPFLGGVQIHILQQCKLQATAGLQPAVFALAKASGGTAGWDDVDGVEVFRAANSLELLCELSSWRPSLVHAHGSRYPLAAAALIGAAVTRTASVFTPHCYYPPTGRLNGLQKLAYDLTLGRAAVRFANRVINLTDVDRDHAISIGGNPERCLIIPNAVDIQQLQTASQDTAWLDEYRIGKYLLYAGRVDRQKNVLFLVRAFAHLKDVDLQLVIIGKCDDPAYQHEIRDFIAREGLGGRVHVLGHMRFEQLVGAYRRAAFFCLPSSFEGLPTVVLEAMVSGAVVLATRAGGTARLVRHGANGFLFEHEDLNGFCSLVRSVVDRDLEPIQREALRTVKSDYSWVAISKRILDLYEALVPAARPAEARTS